MIFRFCPCPSTLRDPLLISFWRCLSLMPRYCSAVLKLTNRFGPRSVASPFRALPARCFVSSCFGTSESTRKSDDSCTNAPGFSWPSAALGILAPVRPALSTVRSASWDCSCASARVAGPPACGVAGFDGKAASPSAVTEWNRKRFSSRYEGIKQGRNSRTHRSTSPEES